MYNADYFVELQVGIYFKVLLEVLQDGQEIRFRREDGATFAEVDGARVEFSNFSLDSLQNLIRSVIAQGAKPPSQPQNSL